MSEFSMLHPVDKRQLDRIEAALHAMRDQRWQEFAERLAQLFIPDNRGELRVLYARMNELPEIYVMGVALGVWGSCTEDPPSATQAVRGLPAA